MISADALTRRFGDRDVLRGLDLRIGAGERVALRGPNGSGKTTALRCVLGTLTPTGGSITVGTHPAGSIEARRLIGASLSQERSFYLRLSGRENLLFYARLRDLGKRDGARAVSELEQELELEEILAKRVDRCSTGMVQQLAFARALLCDPELLLLDEPTRSLDHAAVERLWAAIERRPALALVIATHSEADASRCGEVRDL